MKASVLICLLLLSGCASIRGDKKGIQGREAYAVDLAKEASVNAYEELKGYGAPVRPYTGWKVSLVKVPQDRVWTGWPNADAVTFGINRIEYKGRISGNLMHHEWKHILLHREGITGHPRQYFPEGGTVHRN